MMDQDTEFPFPSASSLISRRVTARITEHSLEKLKVEK